MAIQAHIVYSGQVQGVGFRFTAQRIAQEYRLVGWVRNLPDGKVEVLVEGDREIIDQFLQELELAFQGYIHQKEAAFSAAENKHQDFHVITY